MVVAFQGVPPGLCRRVGGGIEGGLLAGVVQAKPKERLAELGCGCGDVAVRVALANPGVVIDALELRPGLCALARKVVRDHGLCDRVRVVQGDVRALPASMTMGGYDQVFCNPPFFAPHAHRLSPDPDRAAARCELAGGLDDFLGAAVVLLQAGGTVHVVHRPERLSDLMEGCVRQGLTVTRLRRVVEPHRQRTVLVLMTACKKRGEGVGWVEEWIGL
ncbi:MAG: methyltransferase [Magnetococcales bacterium]|nr:methyltransferase [Magnetococcales bacterium]